MQLTGSATSMGPLDTDTSQLIMQMTTSVWPNVTDMDTPHGTCFAAGQQPLYDPALADIAAYNMNFESLRTHMPDPNEFEGVGPSPTSTCATSSRGVAPVVPAQVDITDAQWKVDMIGQGECREIAPGSTGTPLIKLSW